MRLILATHHLGLGGSESYLFTVAEELLRLGHEAIVYTLQRGAGVEVARERGIALADDLATAGDADCALVQDAATSHELATLRPELAQVFVAHSESINLQLPPQLEGQVAVVVALNDRVAERMRSLAVSAEVVRLRQPIAVDRSAVAGPLPGTARHALLLSNNPITDRLDLLERACEAAGLDLIRVGGDSGQIGDSNAAFHRAEIVIGYGRSILEAMAAGRAAYVYDHHGGDGWVTTASYPALEADGFAGRGELTIDEARLTADLTDYSASMGPVNRDLIVANHRANVHAHELVALIEPLGPTSRPRLPHEEMARLVRMEWQGRVEVQALRRELDRARAQLESTRLEAAERTEARIRELRDAYESTRAWRLAEAVRSARAALRRRWP